MSNREVYSGGWGEALDSGQPQGQLAELQIEHKATPQRIAAARQLFMEAALDDFEAVGRTGRRLRHLESGREYMVALDQPLLARDASIWRRALRPRR